MLRRDWAICHFRRAGFLVVAVLSLAGVCQAQNTRLYNVFSNIGGTADETGGQVIQDASGNLFTLSTSGSGLVLAKRDTTGAMVWRSYFPGEPSAFTLTADGGVAVVGRVDRGNNPDFREILTLKYDSLGNLQWKQTLRGVTGLPSPGIFATSTSDGSIYVGATVNQDAFSDASLIKYSSDGTLQWQQTMGPDPNQEIVFGVQPDPAGNILLYVNRNPPNGGPPVIYKFSPAGAAIWTYAAPVNGYAGGYAMDSTGASYLPVNGGSPAVVKVSSAGAQVFKASLGAVNAPLNIAVLGTTPYVAGVQTGTANCFVQKLTAAGAVSWTATHTGPSGEAESLNSLAVGSDGSAYAAGNRGETGSATIFTLKVGTTGTVAWSLDHGSYVYTPPLPPAPPVIPPPLVGTQVLMNLSGQPVTFSTINGLGFQTGYDTELCVDSTSGTSASVNSDDLNGTNDTVDSSATDAAGNTYILGNTEQGGGADVVLQQVHPDGSLGWLRGFGGPGPDLGYALAIMPDASVVVSYGVFNSVTSLWDTRIRHYDASGNSLWTTNLDGSDHVASIVCASDGSTYLVGQDQGVIPNRFHAAKIKSDGTILWSTMFAGVGPADDYPFGLSLDKLGNLFSCGNLWDGTRYLASILKYDTTTGAITWMRDYASSGAGASGFTMMPDNSGGAYLLGTDWASGGRGLIRRYDTNGNLTFNRICTDTDTVGERYVSVALDGSGNLIVGGSAVMADKSVDVLAEKFNSNGIGVWKDLYAGPAGLNDMGRFVALDVFGAIYVGGNASGGVTGRDYVLWKLNPDGSAAWPDSGGIFTHSAMLYDSGLDLADTVGGLSADGRGGIYLTGSAIGPNNTYDLNAMKFGTSVDSLFVSQSVPSTMIAGQTYYVSLTFTNSSSVTWTTAAGFALGTLNPVDNTTWGLNRVALADTDAIASGQSKKFGSFRVFAPMTAGTYNFQWSMNQTGVGPFGQPSVNVPVTVTVGANAARYMSVSIPASVKVGSIFPATGKMTNVGTNVWTVGGGYALAPSGSPTTWGITSVSVGSNVNPGVEKAFNMSCKAPATAGTYVFRFQMKNSGGFFGDQTASKTITVTP